MKAVIIDEHGGPEVMAYREVEMPGLQSGQVRLAMRACSLNYHDILTRRGMPGVRTPLPMVLGCDCAGVSIETAACLPVAYGSAYRMVVHHGQVAEGKKVLVLGASGGVGNCAVQLAKSAGCFVVGACGSEERAATLREKFGVDETIDTSKEDIVAATRRITGGGLYRGGGGFDLVVNSQGGEWWAKGLRCVKYGGRMVTNGALAGFDPPTDIRYIFGGELTVQGSNGWMQEDIVHLLDLVAAGKLAPHIGATYPLDHAIDAHVALEERRHFGKIVVTGGAPVPV
jgi:alcohol dehydrogenase